MAVTAHVGPARTRQLLPHFQELLFVGNGMVIWDGMGW